MQLTLLKGPGQVQTRMLTLYRASRQPSRAFMSDPSRPCTQAGTSSGHVFKLPSPTMTAILVPTVCRSALDGFRMQCSRESCKSEHQHVRHSECDMHMQLYGNSCSYKCQAVPARVLLMMQTSAFWCTIVGLLGRTP